MFGALTQKLQQLFHGLKGSKTLTEENVSDAVRQVRLALLDADVNFSVASALVQRVRAKALGETVLKSVNPTQQFIEIVHSELTELMGSDEVPLDIRGKPAVVMVCGLQGSGKTTSVAKLAHYLRRSEPHKKILLAACDLQRPAAVLQLKKLAGEVGVEVVAVDGETDPIRVAKLAREKASKEAFDVLLVDTAGRLHLDEELMVQLAEMKQCLEPREVLFVANAATGQDAVKTAAEFNARVEITGTILTMLDSNARAGSAISIREVTQKPLKFEGVGERITDLQLFNPRSMADRILGMGDVINLVKKAKEAITEEESAELEKKIRKASFTYNDYLKQMGRVKKMGSLKSLLKMLPGMGAMEGLDFSDQEFKRLEAIILSMTPEEREEEVELEHSRRRRIALGSGVPVDDVNRMVKGFKRVKQLFKNMPGKSSLPDLNQLKQQWKGKSWH